MVYGRDWLHSGFSYWQTPRGVDPSGCPHLLSGKAVFEINPTDRGATSTITPLAPPSVPRPSNHQDPPLMRVL